MSLQRFFHINSFQFFSFLIDFLLIFVPYLYRNLEGDEVALMDTYDTLINKNGR